jgi:hypothetical protein
MARYTDTRLEVDYLAYQNRYLEKKTITLQLIGFASNFAVFNLILTGVRFTSTISPLFFVVPAVLINLYGWVLLYRPTRFFLYDLPNLKNQLTKREKNSYPGLRRLYNQLNLENIVYKRVERTIVFLLIIQISVVSIFLLSITMTPIFLF